MKIELKNFKFYDRLSEETLAFVGNIWVNGVKCGQAQNSGKGGCSSYWHEGTEKSRELIRQAEEYCLKLPAIPHESVFGKTWELDMNLTNYIDELVYELIKKKDNELYLLKTAY